MKQKKDQTEKKLCACGCGEHVKHSKNNYIRGHHLKGKNNPFYGKKHSDKTKKLISEGNKGKLSGNKNPTYGRPRSEETKKKISETMIKKEVSKGKNNPMYGVSLPGRCGEDHPLWTGKMVDRDGYIYNWRKISKEVRKRDNYRCQEEQCGGVYKKVEVHHINFDKTNNDYSNLITLCHKCHSQRHLKNKQKLNQGV